MREVALAGLAPDGGLYLPKIWPHFSSAEIAAMRGQSYQEIAFTVLRPFLHAVMPDDVLHRAITQSTRVFDHPEITPLRRLDDQITLLELFYGPTLAFKDVALQFLGQVFATFLGHSTKRMTIIGATSGDTGSAAMAALAHQPNIDLFILYPEKGPSEIQRKQMTCVDAPNVHALAVQGSFDDCQAIVKDMFADKALRDEFNLTTVNSINLLRILAQIVYYFVAASKLDAPPNFVVPTGNFGDVFAGYAAQQCGLNIAKLVVASNRNDILTRFFATGRMQPAPVEISLSPSMDIQVSSNFERLLFDLCGKDAAQLCDYMQQLKQTGAFAVTPAQLQAAREIFAAGRSDDAQTLAVMRDVYDKHGVFLDPHTAVGVKVARDLAPELCGPIVCLATADAGKFPDSVIRATANTPKLPEKTLSLIKRPERRTISVANKGQITAFIREKK